MTAEVPVVRIEEVTARMFDMIFGLIFLILPVMILIPVIRELFKALKLS